MYAKSTTNKKKISIIPEAIKEEEDTSPRFHMRKESYGNGGYYDNTYV